MRHTYIKKREKKGMSVYERIYPYLFQSQEESGLSNKDEEVRKRFLAAYNMKLDSPLISDKKVAGELIRQFDVSRSTAYQDINYVERFFGSFRKSHKDYVRHMVTETQKKVIQVEMQKLRIDPNADTKNLSYAVKVLSEANNLNQEDPETPNWDAVQPPIPEVSDDVTVIDLTDTDDEKIENLRKKYKKYIQENTEDAEIVDDTE